MSVGLGPIEILVLGGLCCLVVAVGIIGVVYLIVAQSRGKKSGWQPPGEIGPAVRVCAFGPSDSPIVKEAVWQGQELIVQAAAATTLNLFDVPLQNLDQCKLTWRFRLSTDGLSSPVHAELWCRIPGKGRFFSRGLDQKVKGSVADKLIEIPFLLEAGQHADQLNLNLVFSGPGTVRLKDLEILTAPVKAV